MKPATIAMVMGIPFDKAFGAFFLGLEKFIRRPLISGSVFWDAFLVVGGEKYAPEGHERTHDEKRG